MRDMPDSSPIKTAQVQGRRELQFDRIDDALADVEQIATAQRQGNLRSIGNWTPGQTLGHLATWAGYAYDGTPMTIPFFIRWLLKPLKNRFLNQPMRAGSKIPRVRDGTLATEVIPFDQALERFQKNFTRLKLEKPTKPNVMFGEMTQEEWIKLHLRHAELHLSFLRWD
jgi:hypothetical protein